MEIPRITPEQVADHIRRGERVVFLDARSASAYEAAMERIPGAIRVPPGDVDPHVGEIPRAASIVVAYCT